MNFSEYQTQSRVTARYPDQGNNLTYPTLGLCGEAGEVADKLKKIMRDDGGVVSEEKKQDLKIELGDVLWYIAQLSTELGFQLEDVAQTNIDKLRSRMERNMLHGSGDNR
jgi:NTP pyrophosphatase (non-canonical NTP hydrolase)